MRKLLGGNVVHEPGVRSIHQADTGVFCPSYGRVMRKTAFVLVVAGIFTGPSFAQAPPTPPAARVVRPAPTPTVTVQVSDAAGLPLANVQVTAQGPVSRDGATGNDGSIRFANMRAGAYRLRFVREGSITLERDVTVRAGEPLLADVSLTAAPAAPQAPAQPPRPSPEAPSAWPKSLGPPTH